MRYRASFLAYAFWVHKNVAPKNWLMWVKDRAEDILIKFLNCCNAIFVVDFGHELIPALSKMKFS